MSGGHLCRRQKHRPNRQVRPSRRRYLKEHHRILYYNLLTKCKLHDHLADINKEASEMYDKLVKQLAEKEGVTEKLKAENQMSWVKTMNNIRNTANEIVLKELIYH